MKITDFKKKKMKLLTKELQESYENAKICYICKEKFEDKYAKDKKKKMVKLEIIVIILVNTEVLHIVYVKYITFSVPVEKKLQELVNMGKKSQKPYSTYNNLLIAQEVN